MNFWVGSGYGVCVVKTTGWVASEVDVDAMMGGGRTRGRGRLLGGESETERDRESDREQYFVTVTCLVIVTDAPVTECHRAGS